MRCQTILALLLTLTTGVHAADGPGAHRQEAGRLLEAGKPIEAAAEFGKALAQVQIQEEIVLLWKVAGEACDGLDRLDDEVLPDVLAAFMAELDPGVSGACISAHHLAGQLLRQATRSGRRRFLEEATAVLEEHARSRDAGRYAKALLEYAQGLTALAGEHRSAGIRHLKKALQMCADEGWTELAMHVGTECAVAALEGEDQRGATRVLAQVADLCPPSTDPVVARQWRGMVEGRLAGAPPAVLAPYEQAMEPFSKGMSVSAAGGRSVPRPPGGTKAGQALARYSSRTPLVAVQRTDKGFLIREGFDPAFSATQPFASGVKHHVEGGVTLSFWAYGPTLRILDPVGGASQPGERSHPSPLRAYYQLARGEVWGLLKTGAVRISRGR